MHQLFIYNWYLLKSTCLYIICQLLFNELNTLSIETHFKFAPFVIVAFWQTCILLYIMFNNTVGFDNLKKPAPFSKSLQQQNSMIEV